VDTNAPQPPPADSGIFLVDDEREFTELMGALLEQGLGTKVHVFNDPLLALQAMEAGSPRFLITDLAMPRLNGFELMQRVAQHWPELPCLLVTGNQLDPAAIEAQRTPSLVGVLFKPLSWRDIAACVHAHASHGQN
jgi:DNA-binding NtrC family response regulator